MIARLREAERCLTDAERSADRDALTRLIADEFVGVTMHGTRTGKAEFIHSFCDSGLRFDKLDIEDVVIAQTDGAIAIVVGRSVFRGTAGERSLAGACQFVDCWKEIDGRLQLVVSSVTSQPRSE